MGGSNGNIQIGKHRQLHQEINVQKQRDLQTEATAFVPQKQETRRKRKQEKKGVSSGASAGSGFGKHDKVTPMEQYSVTSEEVTNNYSDVRMDAFQENLAFNCRLDSQMEYSAEFSKMMQKITQYAELPTRQTKHSSQCESLKSARDAIKEYLEKHGGENEQADQIAARYQLYFDTFCDGNLEEQDGEAIQVDAVTHAPKIDSKLGSIAFYRNAKDEQLFPHEPSANDVCQRGLGDCYLQAALSSLAMSDPQLLKSSMKDNGDGTVTVRFFKKGYDTEEELPKEVRDAIHNTDVQKMSNTDLVFKLLVSRRSNGPENESYQKFQEKRNNSKKQILQQQTSTPEYQAMTETEKAAVKREINMSFADNVGAMSSFLDGEYSLEGKQNMYKLAEHLAQNPTFQEKVLNKMQRLRDEGGQDLDQILSEGLWDFWDVLFDKDLRKNILSDETQKLLEAAQNPEKEQHKVYVTVKKEVPSVLGADLHSANCLWVQMIEKAYAASGLHSREDIKKLYDRMTQLDVNLKNGAMKQKEYDKQMKECKQEWEKLHSFASIEGGENDKFLEHLTGVSARKSHTEPVVASQKSIQDDLKIENISSQMNNISGVTNSDALMPCAQMVLTHLGDYLEKKLGIEYETKGEKKRYFQDALHIEDITQAIQDAASWMGTYQSDFHTMYAQFLQTGITDTSLQDYLKAVSVAVEEQLKLNSKINYSAMSGQYTPAAVEKFQRIEEALKAHIPVGSGSYKFTPEEFGGGGLNGESGTQGIVEGHAYSVMGVMEKDGKKFVKLRNPWAQTEMQYVTVKKPDGTTSLATRAVHGGFMDMLYTSENKGIFYMELNDFLSKMDDVYFNSNTPVQFP